MKLKPCSIPGAFLIWPQVFRDERGTFFETYHETRYAGAGINACFVQDNRSVSVAGTLRGMHYQIERPQGHLVTLTHGKIFDAGVDLRPGSPSFGQWTGAVLTADPPVQLYLPPGVAHGFFVLSERAEIWYRCTDFYNPGDEGGLLHDDPDINIPWPAKDPVINSRDAALPRLRDIPEERLPKIRDNF